ncbi:MAG: hypothetical protein M3N52_07275 [Actinomycetota bacterium]|nr:hypothetical protein [Actinomycetota bacterium]
MARGDFHDARYVDVVVVADRLLTDPAQRWTRVAPGHGVIQPVVWTPADGARPGYATTLSRSTRWTTASGWSAPPGVAVTSG